MERKIDFRWKKDNLKMAKENKIFGNHGSKEENNEQLCIT